MERLTKRVGDGVRYTQRRYEITCYPKNDNLSDIDKMAVRLCELEDKLESGKLFELADIEDTFCCAMIGTTEQGEKYVSLEDYEHDIYKLGRVIKTYRAKLESGQMIELPCKIGDTIWVVYRDFENRFNEYKICESKCVGFMFEHGTNIRIITSFSCYDCDRVGNFLDKSQAEARLQELRGGE